MTFEIAEDRLVLGGPVVTVHDATLRAPDGSLHERQVVRHPGAVAAVPVIDGTSALLVRQYRVALDGPLLEIPAGKRDVAGEAPEATAAREVEEEIGYRPGHLEQLGEFETSPGFCDEAVTVYLATGLTAGQMSRQGVEEQHMEIVTVDLADVPALIADGELRDAKTIIGLLLAAQRLGV